MRVDTHTSIVPAGSTVQYYYTSYPSAVVYYLHLIHLTYPYVVWCGQAILVEEGAVEDASRSRSQPGETRHLYRTTVPWALRRAAVALVSIIDDGHRISLVCPAVCGVRTSTSLISVRRDSQHTFQCACPGKKRERGRKQREGDGRVYSTHNKATRKNQKKTKCLLLPKHPRWECGRWPSWRRRC